MGTQAVRFETLIELYHDEIYGYLWRLLRGAGRTDGAVEAQDLTQEAFLRAYRAFGRLRRDSNHRAWLYKIATNCAYSNLKRGQRPSGDSLPVEEVAYRLPSDPQRSPDRQMMLQERLEQVRQEIARLPPKQQAAVVMRHLQGLKYAEIAQALDCSEDSARANVYQGLRRLRRRLAEE